MAIRHITNEQLVEREPTPDQLAKLGASAIQSIEFDATLSELTELGIDKDTLKKLGVKVENSNKF